MIVFPAEWNARKEAVFAALAGVDGGGRRLPAIPVAFRGRPGTAARAEEALARAKRQPQGIGRIVKRALLRGQYDWARRHFEAHPDHVAVAWNGTGGSRRAFLMGARDAGAATLFAELAPLPGRITLDPRGVNAESSVPQDPAFFRDWARGRDTAGWRDAGAGLAARQSRRADVGQGGGAPPGGPYLFCPLQVPGDSQVTVFAGWCGGMAGFLSALAAAAPHLPPGWHLRVKEHPSARTRLDLALLVATGRVIVDNAADSFAQVAGSRGVVTLNSSMGLQAFFWGKPVVVLGRAFWALPGLAAPVGDQAALEAAFADAAGLTCDGGLRAAFVAWLAADYYPRFDPATGAFDRAAFAAKLAQARGLSRGPGLR